MNFDILNDLLTRTVSNLFVNKKMHMLILSEDDEKEEENNFQEKPSKDSIFTDYDENIMVTEIKANNENLKEKEFILNSNLISNSIIKENEHCTLKPKYNLNNLNNLEIQNDILENKEYNLKTATIQPKKNKTNLSLCTPELWSQTIGKKIFEESLKILNINEHKILSPLYLTYDLQTLISEKAKVKNELKRFDQAYFSEFKSKPTQDNKAVMKPLYYYYHKIKTEIEKRNNQSLRLDTTNNTTILGGELEDNIYTERTYTDGDVLCKNDIKDLEKEYFNIKKEQSEITIKLKNYQKEFQKTNNRKVKWVKDIKPVENDYKKYKKNKERIDQIKKLLENKE